MSRVVFIAAWIFAVHASCMLLADTVLADIVQEGRGKQDGVALYISARDAFQGLTSYRCRLKYGDQSECQFAFSGAMYRIVCYEKGDVESIRTFDGETYSQLSLKTFLMRTGTRAPSRVPMVESPYNMCYGLYEVSLDHYHSQGFLEKQTSYIKGSEPSVYRDLPCLKLSCVYASRKDGCVWISKEYFGFPVAKEVYSNTGDVLERLEVREHEVVHVDGRDILFPIHINVRYGISRELRPELQSNVVFSEQGIDFKVDRASLEINPTIPISEFQIDPTQAKMIENTDTGEIALQSGDVLMSDLQPKTSSPKHHGPASSLTEPAKSKPVPWILIVNGVLLFSFVAFWGYKRWIR